MLKWLICSLFGHQCVTKVFTGKYLQEYDAWSRHTSKAIYGWELLDFCLRCSKPRSMPTWTESGMIGIDLYDELHREGEGFAVNPYKTAKDEQ